MDDEPIDVMYFDGVLKQWVPKKIRRDSEAARVLNGEPLEGATYLRTIYRLASPGQTNG